METGTLRFRDLTARKLLGLICIAALLPAGETQSFHQLEDSAIDSKTNINDDADEPYQNGIGDCSFELDYCSYIMDYFDGRCAWSWLRDNDSPDHTFNNKNQGVFVSVTELPKNDNRSACLASPQFPATDGKPRCLTFWYRLRGNLIRSLRIVVSRDLGLENGIVVWELDTDQGSGWMFGRTSVYFNEDHHVVFEAVPANVSANVPIDGVVALDDIIFTEGPCSVLPSEARVEIVAPPSTTTHAPLTTVNPDTEFPDYSCKFEDTLCYWRTEGGNLSWVMAIEGVDANVRLPDHDRTGTGTGHYIYAQPSLPSVKGGIAELECLLSLPPKIDVCLVFWYHMYGSDVDTLNVYLKQSGSLGAPIWARKRNQGVGWKKGMITIEPSNDDVYIVFEAHIPSSLDSVIALDDVSVSHGACPENWMNCDFELSKQCNYTSNNDLVGWSYQSGEHIAPGSVPAIDHTFNSGYGHYVLVNGTFSPPLVPFTLTSPVLPSHGYMCIRFWYYMTNDEQSSLTVTLNDIKNDYILHLDGRLEFDPRWRVAQTSFKSTSESTWLVFTSRMGFNPTSIIALDDIQITNGFCSDEGDCNMENGNLCTWNNDPNDHFDWLIGEGRNEIAEDAGPDEDHTWGVDKGHYIYFDAGKHNAKEAARIYSKTFESDKNGHDRCIHFWYNFQGDHPGTLNIYQNLSFGTRKIWEAKEGQVAEWNYGKAQIIGDGGSHQLIIEGVVGEMRNGSIAMDDIVIADNGCSVEPVQIDIGPGISTDVPWTTPVGWLPLEELLSCDFQRYDQFCRWNQSSSDDIDWSVGNLMYPESTSPYDPPFTRYIDYIYVWSNFQPTPGAKAILVSPTEAFNSKNVYCISFDYYMFGSDAGNLTLLIDFGLGDSSDIYLITNWKRVGPQEDRWLRAITPLKLLTTPYMGLQLMAERGSDGVIAVQQFEVNLGECSQFIACEFESQLNCPWQMEDGSPLAWQDGSGNYTNFTGPAVDHTTQTEIGLYQFVRNQRGENAIGRFISPKFTGLHGVHCFSFWYYMGLAGTGALEVLAKNDDLHSESESLWVRGGDRSPRWHLAQVPIVMYKDFQIVLEATFDGKNDDDLIAIDDLKISPTPCDQQASCTFDDGPCGYTNDVIDDDFNWLLGFGRTRDPEAIVGPMSDASGIEDGLYMYVDMSMPINEIDASTAVLRSDIVFGSPINPHYCLEFSYIKLGTDQSNLNIRINKLYSTNDSYQYVFLSGEEPVPKWSQQTITFESSEDFEIIFEAIQPRRSTHAFIGIDEVHLINNPYCKETQENHTLPEASLYSCDFENGKTCNWTLANGAVTKWRITQGEQHNRGSKPDFDHTKQNYAGHYLLKMGAPSFDQYASLVSPEIKATGDVCFTFWYQMYGRIACRLEIALVADGNTLKTMWEKVGTQGPKWIYAQVPFANNQATKIEIRGYADYNTAAYIAIDDIAVSLAACPPQKLCTFDDNEECGFDQGPNDGVEWELTLNPIPDGGDFPPDHTTLTREGGRYIYLDASGTSENRSSNFISKVYHPPMDNVCVKFWFYTATEFSKFSVHLWDFGVPSDDGERFEGHLSDWWNLAAVPFHPKTDWQVTFEGLIDSYKDVFVALDDIEISYNDSCSSAEYCDFQVDDCFWHNEDRLDGVTDKAEWMRRLAVDAFGKTGPRIDHTTHLPTGFYLLAQPSSEKSNGDTAVLLSSVLVSRTYKCFSFWYHSDDTNGALEIWYHSSSGNSAGDLLDTVALNLTHVWISRAVDLPTNVEGHNFLLKIVAVFGSGNNAIAVDDLLFEKTSCEDASYNLFMCENGNKTILQSQVCDYMVDCADGSDERACGNCDFEGPPCGYMDASGVSRFEWTFSKAEDASQMIQRELVDHTFGNKSGHFAWVSGLGEIVSIRDAIMHSPLIQYASSTCHLTFWLYIPKQTDQFPRLQVSVVTANGYQKFSIFDSYGCPTDHWTKVPVYIGYVPEPFTIEFLKMANSYSSDNLAVDDIKFIQCKLQMANCSEGLFQCKSQNGCVEKNRVCDFTPDCDDASDEADCQKYMMCDFEDGFCHWESLDKGGWIREQAGVLGPPRDHTLGTNEGSVIKAGWIWQTGGLLSSKLGGLVFAATENCTMRFYYYLANPYKFMGIFLKISTRQYANGDLKDYLIRDKSAAEYMLREEITFNESKAFEVIIEAFVPSNSYTVAVDDISFDDASSCQLLNISLPIGSTTEPDFCTEDEFLCNSADRSCIDIAKVCDFNDDCSDGSDEHDCGACTFETRSCGWKDASTGMFHWEVRQGRDFKESNADNIPTEDHTTDTTDGSYFLLTKNTAGNSFATSSWLESPEFGATGPSCYLSFWYHTTAAAGTLSLYMQNLNRAIIRPIATLLPNEYVDWKQYEVTLGELDAGYQVVFEAIVNEQDEFSKAVAFAIDDVTFTNCSLNYSMTHVTFHNLSCDFEEGLCDWHRDIGYATADWKVGSGATPTEGTGPMSDHTTGTGYYLFVEYDAIRTHNFALLVSSIMPKTDGLCLRFWYHMFGEYLGTLSVTIATVNGKTSQLIWSQTGSQGNLWRSAMASIIFQEPYQIIITGESGIDRRSDIGLDDITLIDGQCPQMQDVLCSFELGTCGWNATASDKGNWTRTEASQVPHYWGSDHTANSPSAQVMYAKFVSGSPSKLSLRSEVHKSSPEGSCFRYWYIITRGDPIHFSLDATVTFPDEASSHHDVWDVNPLGTNWELAQVSVDPDKHFQITLTASYDRGPVPAIAIDDFSLVNSRCPEPGSCDFEYDWCGWTQDDNILSNTIKWLRNSGSTKSDFTGPDSDHTRGEYGNNLGYYVFIDSSSGKPGQKAIMTSPRLSSGRTVCFSFYYNMLGEETGKLSVYAFGEHEQRVEIFSTEGDKGVDWRPIFIEIHDLPSSAQLEIEATLTGGVTGDIALDDLRVQPDKCSEAVVIITTPLPSTTTALPSTTTAQPPTSPEGTSTITTQMPQSTSTASNLKTTTSVPILTELPTTIAMTTLPKTTEVIINPTESPSITVLPTKTVFPSTATQPATTFTQLLETTTPKEVPLASYLKRCGNSTSPIVSVFAWCDGIQDCPDGEDEASECTVTCSDDGEFYCSEQKACITMDKICDGTPDCGESDAIDESICGFGCFQQFCIHGDCSNEILNSSLIKPSCKCNASYIGYRCQQATSEPKPTTTTSKAWIAAIVVPIVLILIGVGIFVYRKYYIRRVGDRQPIIIDNPTYEYPTS